MISDNILKWYTDEIIRSKYNVLGWSLIEKQIKEDKTKLVFETSNTKLSLEFKKLSETTIIFNNIVCKEEVPKTKINGVEYYLEESIWAEVFDEKLLNKGLELENMTIEEIETESISCIEKAFERMASIKTNNNLSLFDEDEKNDIKEAEIIEVTETGNDNQNLLEDKTDKKEDNPNEVDKTDEIEEEKPKKRGRKPKNQNRDEE
ncbi:hypothetical protein [Fusobacterium polymorphum]|uniref:Uncharacterized protein n=1 Tax=Fusobacterium nucleatum subsp. polymorphum TaxID=76857 RepID=A0A2C6BPE2_FUSNP|nr:hypothetical protein [Fusobacterium polymorphum]PHI05715.1 hypothetical protein CBG54_00875 [Fusobacterium polymorphum]